MSYNGGGTNRNRHRMRCSRGKKGCGSRFTLHRPLSSYKRAVKCPYCRSKHVNDVEQDRQREKKRENTCFCNAYPFPHNAGSLRFCKLHPYFGVEPSECEIDDYKNCIDTPRSGVTS